MSIPNIAAVCDLLNEARDLLRCVTVLREHDEQDVADDLEGKLHVLLKRTHAAANEVYALGREASA